MIITNFLLNEIKSKLIFFIYYFSVLILKKTKNLVSTYMDSDFLLLFLKKIGLIFYNKF